MNIPQKISICDWDYKILVEKNPTTKEDPSTVCWGTVDTNSQEIKVNNGSPIERAQETILHEIFHAIDERFLYGEEKIGEKRIIVFAHVLRDIIRNNPKLIDFIKE